MRKIAIEEHVSMPEFDDIMREVEARLKFPNLSDPDRMKNTLGPLMSMPPEQHRIPTMDKYGIDIQIVSCGGSGIQNILDPKTAIEACKKANDHLQEFIKAFPGRFKGFAILPMQDPAAAVEELERCVKEYGFVGVMQHGHTNFHYYDEAQFYPVWAKLEELDVPLYIHVANPEADQIRIYDDYPELLGNTWNWGYTGGTHALRIIFGGIFDRYPNAKLIMGHMGEGIPYVMGRLDEGYDCRNVKKKGRMAHHPSYYLKKNFYLSTSGQFYPEALTCAISAIGLDKILFANDYPHYPTENSVNHVESCPLTREQREMIYYKNAEKLFKL